ncbi:MAG TPA: hypothetical protein VG779_02460 [Actinomycetota bacterium]|jgi:carbamoyl-phosphate synthase large subunit|nr:hypothetical protein [Actinomycetota bacterium]
MQQSGAPPRGCRAQGVSLFADLLLRCAATETDAAVGRTLAATVARQQWEPHGLIGSRGTAALAPPPPAEEPTSEVRPIGAVVPEALPGCTLAAVPPAVEHGFVAPAWIARSLAAPNGRADAGVRGGTIIVTGAGGPAGVAVIRALDRHDGRVVGVDADGLAAGLRLADERAVVPREEDP